MRRRSSSPSPTRTRRRACATRAAPPATPRAWSTATAARSCTRWGRCSPTASACASPTACCRSCRCSTPTRGASPTPAVATGADLVMPGPDLSGKALADLIVEERVTLAAGVPTIWMQVLPELARPRHVEPAGDPVRRLGGAQGAVGGVPRAARPADPAGVGDDRDQPDRLGEPARRRHRRPRRGEQAELRTGVGRALFGVEARVVEPDSDVPVPSRRHEHGELQCRGPWIAATYYNDPRAGESFTSDGWLRTGDVATMDERGRIRLVDRTKDLIKSGGEWISSVELENELMAHPEIREAAVIGVPDERWAERPLACVVRVDGSELTAEEVLEFLAPTRRQVAAARPGGVHRRGAQDQRRQVLQEDAARTLRQRDLSAAVSRWRATPPR